MFSLPNKVKFIVAFLFFNLTIQSSTSSPLENDKLAQLVERLDRMQIKMDSENVKLIERLNRIQTKMDTMRSRVDVLEDENDKWTRKFGDLEAENEKLKTAKLQQDEQLQHLKSQIISHPKLSSTSTAKQDDGQSSRVWSSPPTSCQELKNQNGKVWPIDGIHLLKINNKIQAAFCTFADDGSNVSESLIGQVDVKTKSVHFYVQRNSTFSTIGETIPFQVARLNEGNAFDLTSGYFKAPVKGIYHFDFSAIHITDYIPDHISTTSTASAVRIYLLVNSYHVGATYTEQDGLQSKEVATLSASLRLAAGDSVSLYLEGVGVLYDIAAYSLTHFSGWLVEEDLM